MLRQTDVLSQKMALVDGQMIELKDTVDRNNYFKSIFLNVSFENVCEKATKEDKYIFLYFTSKGCGYCKLMERTILSDSITENFKEKYLCFKNNRDSCGYFLDTEFKIRAYPTFIILDDKRTIIKKHIGYMTLSELGLFLDEKKI